jgi:hypothetical protein
MLHYIEINPCDEKKNCKVDDEVNWWLISTSRAFEFVPRSTITK